MLRPSDNPEIPVIDNTRLFQLAAIIKPLRKVDDTIKLLKLTEECLWDFRNRTFLWDAKVDESTCPPKLVEIARYVTYHTWGYHGFFKPSLAEVFAQMPSSVAENAYGFTIEPSDTYGALTPCQKYQWAVCTVYGKDYPAPLFLEG